MYAWHVAIALVTRLRPWQLSLARELIWMGACVDAIYFMGINKEWELGFGLCGKLSGSGGTSSWIPRTHLSLVLSSNFWLKTFLEGWCSNQMVVRMFGVVILCYYLGAIHFLGGALFWPNFSVNNPVIVFEKFHGPNCHFIWELHEMTSLSCG